MKSNTQLNGIVTRTIHHVYRDRETGFDRYLPEPRQIDLAKYHVPERGTPIQATLRLYENRTVVKKSGSIPKKALIFKRGAISLAFSRKSRRRLMDAFHSWQIPQGWKRFHIILTYPKDYPNEWQIWKEHLKAFKRKIHKLFGQNMTGYWRLELQKRGAPHFHLFIALAPKVITNKGLKKWVTRAWAKIAHSSDQYQGKYATTTKFIINDKMAFSYVSKYCAKVPDKPKESPVDCYTSNSERFRIESALFEYAKAEEISIGRHWGRIGKPDEQPILEYTLSEQEQAILRPIITAWLAIINPTYAEKIANKPDFLTYQVYGLKGSALALLLPSIYARPPSPRNSNHLI